MKASDCPSRIPDLKVFNPSRALSSTQQFVMVCAAEADRRPSCLVTDPRSGLPNHSPTCLIGDKSPA